MSGGGGGAGGGGMGSPAFTRAARKIAIVTVVRVRIIFFIRLEKFTDVCG